MKTKYLIGAALSAITISGIGIGSQIHDTRTSFIDPILLTQSLCGKDDASALKRRAFFIKAGTALAEQKLGGAPEDNTALKPVASISYKISTANEQAQTLFNAGLAHTFNFNHGAAIEAFKKAQEADPNCAMCFWAESLAYGPNINAPMVAEAAAPAHAALVKAQSLRNSATNKERDLINALSYRYEPQHNDDRAKLDNAYADAMEDVAKKYSDDDLIAVLSAEANMDTQPWDYWEADRRTPKGRSAQTMSLIEAVLARNPKHVAATHLYIHMTENTLNPYRAANYADELGASSPGLGHLIHMPSHTYYRIGRYKQAMQSNIDAVLADEAFINANDANPIYEFGYYTHNIHLLMTAALMGGDRATSLAMAEKLNNKLPSEMAAAVPFAQPIKAAPYYVLAQYEDPEKVLELSDPGDELPFLQGVWHYARGEAHAKLGDADGAHEEAEAIAEIAATADLSGLEAAFIPALDVLNIARLTVTAKAASLDDDLDTAIEAMEAAVALQDKIAYSEPPYWYYPAKQTLAALVLRSGDAERAEQLFLEALVDAPNNGRVLYGLSEAYKAQKDKSGRKFARKLLKDAWLGDKDDLSMSNL